MKHNAQTLLKGTAAALTCLLLVTGGSAHAETCNDGAAEKKSAPARLGTLLKRTAHATPAAAPAAVRRASVAASRIQVPTRALITVPAPNPIAVSPPPGVFDSARFSGGGGGGGGGGGSGM